MQIPESFRHTLPKKFQLQNLQKFQNTLAGLTGFFDAFSNLLHGNWLVQVNVFWMLSLTACIIKNVALEMPSLYALLTIFLSKNIGAKYFSSLLYCDNKIHH